ncbi:hypothetical protein GDO81_014351 [Engystomops pustulosus]|uniref:Apolipoprotein C-II n=1 Tax=Engystomops pustulosus TaxID=76066 RepID=A0AAV7BA57_ENGPU|nr:hypothetical protein GDO81_014351 [Engystomops pustulosus]
MKLLVISALLALVVCAVSAQEETYLSQAIDYFQDLGSDFSSKTTEALNQVRELSLAQQAIDIYDSGTEYISGMYTSVLNTAMKRWEELTKSF